MNKAFVAILVAAVLYLTANAEIKVAIHKDSCNSASLNPAYSSRKSIEAQLTINGKIKGTAVADSDFTSANLANYDVIYLGCGGKDTELDALSTSAAQAIVNFVNNGGGLVLSATSATAFSAARSVLEPIMPVPSNSMAWAKTSTQNTVPLLTVTQQHYITSHAITSQYVAPLAFAFYVQSQPKSDWTSIADVSANTAECCLGFSSCDDSYCDPYVSQGILVKQFSSGGRVAYINFPFCGYEMFGPHNLRAGNINQLFLNMFYWTSGKCKGAANECNNHGACTGLNTCSCESGWDGEYCNQPSCNDVQCKNGGTCVLRIPAVASAISVLLIAQVVFIHMLEVIVLHLVKSRIPLSSSHPIASGSIPILASLWSPVVLSLQRTKLKCLLSPDRKRLSPLLRTFIL